MCHTLSGPLVTSQKGLLECFLWYRQLKVHLISPLSCLSKCKSMNMAIKTYNELLLSNKQSKLQQHLILTAKWHDFMDK